MGVGAADRGWRWGGEGATACRSRAAAAAATTIVVTTAVERVTEDGLERIRRPQRVRPAGRHPLADGELHAANAPASPSFQPGYGQAVPHGRGFEQDGRAAGGGGGGCVLLGSESEEGRAAEMPGPLGGSSFLPRTIDVAKGVAAVERVPAGGADLVACVGRQRVAVGGRARRHQGVAVGKYVGVHRKCERVGVGAGREEKGGPGLGSRSRRHPPPRSHPRHDRRPRMRPRSR